MQIEAPGRFRKFSGPRLLGALLLLAATWAVYRHVGGHGFLMYDDPKIFSQNAFVNRGLTLPGIRWALTTIYTGNWTPVAWLSHMTQVQVFGMEPGYHHVFGVLLHLANVLLLFVVLERLTGALWRSVCVAALFAIHPLHVESVAWLTEQRTLLCCLFWLLACLAYRRYARAPGLRTFLPVLLAFVLGFASKPIAAPLPLTLLLLDFWPFRRLRQGGGGPAAAWPLLAEKIPLFALMLLFGAAAALAQLSGGASNSLEHYSLGVRAANGVVSYVAYLDKTILPRDLSMFYPHPGASLPVWRVAGAALVFLSITAWVFGERARRPFLAFGWLWYAVTLAPVAGVFQAGDQAMADRYTYIPLIGVFVAVVWGGAELVAKWRFGARAGAVAALLAVALFIPSSAMQADFWRSDLSLFGHALEVGPRNYVAHNNYGLALEAEGRFEEAAGHYREALRIRPTHVTAFVNLGNYHRRAQRHAEALEAYRKALALVPSFEPAVRSLSSLYVELGILADRRRSWGEALGFYREALRIQPSNARAYNSLGVNRRELGLVREAVAAFSEAARLDPSFEDARFNLGLSYVDLGDLSAARAEYDALRSLGSARAEQLLVFIRYRQPR